MAQTIKSLPAVRETQVRYLAWEDPLEKEMATHSSALAWKIPWIFQEENGGAWQATVYGVGRKESDTTERLHFFLLTVK